MPLTERQKKQYVKFGGNRCPYCSSEDLNAGKLQSDAGYVWQKVSCDHCAREWTDVYTLTGIDEDKEKS